MKKAMLAASVILIAGCSAQSEQKQSVGMANPASVYCIEQGGKLTIDRDAKGDVGYCVLPSGERIEEWALYRRDKSN